MTLEEVRHAKYIAGCVDDGVSPEWRRLDRLEKELTMSIRDLTLSALTQLEATPPAHIYAGRRGLVAGLRVSGKDSAHAFRRLPGGIRLEIWNGVAGDIRYLGMVPADLVARVQAVLDKIP